MESEEDKRNKRCKTDIGRTRKKEIVERQKKEKYRY